jgi:hypothetical protein
MEEKICIAGGIEADSLIGTTVYFEAKRLVKSKGSFTTTVQDKEKRISVAQRPYYNMVPGTVLHTTAMGVVIEGPAGGLYNRVMADVVLPEDLDSWMQQNPTMWVMRGDQ